MAKFMQVGVDDVATEQTEDRDSFYNPPAEPNPATDSDAGDVTETVAAEEGKAIRPVPNINADIAALKEQMAAILGVVKAQQQSMAVMQEQGLRVSDAMAMRYPDLQAQIQMGPKGWLVEMTGPWSMAHVNQVRLAMRTELQQMATRGRKEQLETTLAHRKTGIVPRVGLEEVSD